LQSTNMSVSDISSSVGFSDYNYFVKSFKKYYGVSTKAIRKNI
ncbi:MAG: helix-turn-helix transcriptional regulator, partial [Clostridia bacterium]|nr:helix-turn-helix transcriptional regulator [Clostridia bacterium]